MKLEIFFAGFQGGGRDQRGRWLGGGQHRGRRVGEECGPHVETVGRIERMTIMMIMIIVMMMMLQVWSSAISATLASKFLVTGGLLVLPGAQPATGATPGMMGYGMAKVGDDDDDDDTDDDDDDDDADDDDDVARLRCTSWWLASLPPGPGCPRRAAWRRSSPSPWTRP